MYFLKGYRFSSKFDQIYFICHLSNLLLNTFPATCFIALQSVDVIYFTLFPPIKRIKFYFVIRFILYLLFLFLLQSQLQKGNSKWAHRDPLNFGRLKPKVRIINNNVPTTKQYLGILQFVCPEYYFETYVKDISCFLERVVGGRNRNLQIQKINLAIGCKKIFPIIPRAVDIPNYCYITSYKVGGVGKNRPVSNNFFSFFKFLLFFWWVTPIYFCSIGKCVAFYKACWVTYTMQMCTVLHVLLSLCFRGFKGKNVLLFLWTKTFNKENAECMHIVS